MRWFAQHTGQSYDFSALQEGDVRSAEETWCDNGDGRGKNVTRTVLSFIQQPFLEQDVVFMRADFLPLVC